VQQSEVFRTMMSVRGPYNSGGSATKVLGALLLN
jgi:hypothetical protein